MDQRSRRAPCQHQPSLQLGTGVDLQGAVLAASHTKFALLFKQISAGNIASQDVFWTCFSSSRLRVCDGSSLVLIELLL